MGGDVAVAHVLLGVGLGPTEDEVHEGGQAEREQQPHGFAEFAQDLVAVVGGHRIGSISGVASVAGSVAVALAVVWSAWWVRSRNVSSREARTISRSCAPSCRSAWATASESVRVLVGAGIRVHAVLALVHV